MLARYAPFLGRCFFAFFFLRPTGLKQKPLEELAVLVEVFDRVVMVGAWALHEPMEVARRVLLGLCARVISRGDQRGVGRSAAIFSVLFPLLHGGALILILELGLAFASASIGVQRARRSLEALDKGPWSRAIRAGTPVAAASVSVWPKLLVYRRSVWSSCQA